MNEPVASSPVTAVANPLPKPVVRPTVVLVIDDEAPIRGVVQRSLERIGLQVLQGADGAEGLRVWNERRQDIGLIIVDLNMPIMDGVTVVRAVRAAGATQLPIIAFSGNLSDEQRRDLGQLRVYAILQKPFRFDDLVMTVRAAVDPL